jgi:hypothetical protein
MRLTDVSVDTGEAHSVNSWTGSGYTILDPATGAGAYKIAGGSNGGFLHWLDNSSALLRLAAWALTFLGGPYVWLACAIAFALVAAELILYLAASDGTCGYGG